MTIFTYSQTEEKPPAYDGTPTEVVSELSVDEKGKPAPVVPSDLVSVGRRGPARRSSRRVRTLLCVVGTCLLLVIVLSVLLVLRRTWWSLFRHGYLARGHCGVTEDFLKSQRHFEQMVTVNDSNVLTVDVPNLEGIRRATIVHDFQMNTTTLSDLDRRRCYVAPLNRSEVKPPVDWEDLLAKFMSGTYNPHVRRYERDFRMIARPLSRHEMYKLGGPTLLRQCSGLFGYRTYRLVPKVLSRRPKRGGPEPIKFLFFDGNQLAEYDIV